jgi:glucosamine 6-phosphate synthetase-like amidotransferase/phosphosugar isomerase protein
MIFMSFRKQAKLMCGIAGYIGQSKKPKATYELITSLFDYLELRGTDASGVWGTEFGKKGRVVYHKEPVRSSEFIKNDFWNKLRKVKTDLLLIHARATSKGGGDAANNCNNHPFVSVDKRIGMVHNGTIEEAEFLKNKYETVSETDSEYLLRIYEHGTESNYTPIHGVPDEICKRLQGIKDIWSIISVGAMAVALGERINDNQRCLLLFRNEKRPLWLADLRKTLGQIFFFSSPDIWYRALAAKDELKKLCCGSQKLIELPPFQVWYLQIDKENPVVTDKNIFKFSISTSQSDKKWEKGDYCKMKQGKIKLSVVTLLDDEEFTQKNKPKIMSVSNVANNQNDHCWDDPNEYDGEEFCMFYRNDHEELCNKIKALAEKIDTVASNICMEGSIHTHEYQELLESLEQHRCDLEKILQILTHS